MPSPNSIISAYPPDNLENIIQEKQPKKLHVYIDLKNVMLSLFVIEVVEKIVVNSETMKNVDSSIFQATLYISSWWKNYAYKRGMDCDVFISTDIGRSKYHLSLDKNYKLRRTVGNVMHSEMLDVSIKEIRDKNFNLSDKIINKIPGIYYFCTRFLEADFVPYYLITRKFKEPGIFHVVCSSDKDLFQCLINDMIVMIYKSKNVKKLLDYTYTLYKYSGIDKLKNKVKFAEQISKIDRRYLTLIMAIVGDAGDDVKGVNTIGTRRAMQLISDTKLVDRIVGSPQQLEDRVSNGGNVFLEDRMPISSLSKMWQKVMLENKLVTNSFKLISFEQLCRWLETRDDTSKIEWIKYIDRVLSKEGLNLVPTANSLIYSLSKLEDNQLTESDVNVLFA